MKNDFSMLHSRINASVLQISNSLPCKNMTEIYHVVFLKEIEEKLLLSTCERRIHIYYGNFL